MTTELATQQSIEAIGNTQTAIAPTTLLNEDSLRFLAQMIERANLVPYEKNLPAENQRARVMSKIIGGSAHGFDPISSQTFLHVVNNRLELSASGISCKIKESGTFDYRIDQLDDEGCQLTALILVERDGERKWEAQEPPVVFTREMAEGITTQQYGKEIKLTEKETYKNFGPDMFFARCATRLAKRYFPQVLRGSAWSNPMTEVVATPPPSTEATRNLAIGSPEHGEQLMDAEQDKVAPIGSITPRPDTPEEQHEQIVHPAELAKAQEAVTPYEKAALGYATPETVQTMALREQIMNYSKSLDRATPDNIDSLDLEPLQKMLSALMDDYSKLDEETDGQQQDSN